MSSKETAICLVQEGWRPKGVAVMSAVRGDIIHPSGRTDRVSREIFREMCSTMRGKSAK